jgi:hypothetical protein
MYNYQLHLAVKTAFFLSLCKDKEVISARKVYRPVKTGVCLSEGA